MNKNIIRIPALSMSMLLACFMQGQAAPTDLFLSPDIKAHKVDTASLDDSRLSGAAPVANDAKAVLGWHTATFTGPVVGYVPDSKIGKDLLPVNGTPIYAAPGENSPQLGTFAFGDALEVLDTGTWWKVTVETSFPVYFIADSLPPVPLSQPAASEEIEIYPSVIEDDSTVFDASVEPDSQVSPTVSIGEQTREPRIGVVSRSYTGKLVRANRGIGPFRPKAPFELLSNKGKRLVWVNFTEIIMPGTIRAFIDKDVHIRGEPVQDEKSREWIVYVRTIHETP